jgi:integrase
LLLWRRLAPLRSHIQIKDLDGVRHRLLVSYPKGGRQRYTLLSDNLLSVLRDYYRQAHPKIFLFPGTEPLAPINKATGQNIFYGAVAKARLPDRGGIHSLRQNAECRKMPSEAGRSFKPLRDSHVLGLPTRHFQRPCKNARSLSPGR